MHTFTDNYINIKRYFLSIVFSNFIAYSGIIYIGANKAFAFANVIKAN